MENLEKLKDLVGNIEIEQKKVNVGNKSAATRLRKHLQEIKALIPGYRQEVLKAVNPD